MTGDVTGVTWLFGGIGLLSAGLLTLEAWLTTHVIGQRRRLGDRLDALEARAAEPSAQAAPASTEATHDAPVPAPPFRLPSLEGGEVELGKLLARGRPVMLLFMDSRRMSHELVTEISAWQANHNAPLTVAIITGDSPAPETDVIVRPGIAAVLMQEAFAVSRDYGVRFAPAAVLIRPSGAVVGDPIYGVPGVRALLGRLGPASVEAMASRAAASESAAQAIGSPAPPLRLPDLNGDEIDLADFAGQPALLLFWSPRCGYCDQIKRDLQAWAADPPPEAPRLLVVARGTAEENTGFDIAASVVLDEHHAASQAYGVQGTPSAVLIDAEGRVASAPARGVRSVRALIGLDAPVVADSSFSR